jgi:hypothetical protein
VPGNVRVPTPGTGLKPAPKPPVPEEVVVPGNVRVPTPSMEETVPACEPVAPIEPDPPLVLVNWRRRASSSASSLSEFEFEIDSERESELRLRTSLSGTTWVSERVCFVGS